MSTINKNSTPWFLVVVSMILLFIFVGYWNVSTYLREKKKLAEDVEIQLQLAFTETKDSELVYFIKTQMTGKELGDGFPDSISIFLDNEPIFSQLNSHEVKSNDNPSDKDTTIIIDLEYKSPYDSLVTHNKKNREITLITSSKVNSIIVDDIKSNSNDSVKYDFRYKKFPLHNLQNKLKTNNTFSDSSFITHWEHINDSFPSRFNPLFFNDCDTASTQFRFGGPLPDQLNTSVDKTYALFKQKLINNNLPHLFNIVKHPASEEDGLRVIYKSNGFGFTDWIVDLQKYQLFIFKKMIPTLLFSLFLLGIIGLAFWTLLRNWIKQNRLVVVKNEFINNMTHELKTPIATVGVALEAISNFDLEEDKEKTQEYLDISRNEISKLALLVDKVLNIASFDSHKSTLKSEVVNLEKSVQDTIYSMKLQLEERNASIDFKNQVDNPFILGDKLHMSNVIHNIIDNALKYTLTNPAIHIDLSENQSHLLLTIKDNGQGVPKEYQNKIFDRFFRVPNDDRHDVKGHGLGLNYVQNVVHEHGGKIEVTSVENLGSTFTITLPKSVTHV